MRRIMILLMGILLFSCHTGLDTARMEQELMVADREFSNLSVEKGFAEAFEQYCADEGVLLRPNQYPITGKAAVVSSVHQTDAAGIELSWEPLFARAAGSGDLGYTYGIYNVRLPSDSIISRGTYVTIWENKEGSWKFLLDSGNEGLGE